MHSSIWHTVMDSSEWNTLVHATSCDVARAHCVAVPITLFWSSWFSHLLATPLAFSTKLAVALATALANASNKSCSNEKLLLNKSWPTLPRHKPNSSPMSSLRGDRLRTKGNAFLDQTNTSCLFWHQFKRFWEDFLQYRAIVINWITISCYGVDLLIYWSGWTIIELKEGKENDNFLFIGAARYGR